MSNNVLQLKLNTGAELPLRAVTAKSGKRYWAITTTPTSGKMARYGVPVNPEVVGGKLPTSLEVNGTKVPLATTEKQGQRRVANAPIGTIDGEDFVLSFTCTKLGNGAFNVTANAHRKGGAGGRKAVSAL